MVVLRWKGVILCSMFFAAGLLAGSCGEPTGDDDDGQTTFCTSDADCPGSNVCDGGSCVPPSAGDGGASCIYDGDCADDESCVNGTCTVTGGNCTDECDCPAGQLCEDGVCTLPTSCATDEDCPQGFECNAFASPPCQRRMGCTEDAHCACNEYCDVGSNSCKPVVQGCVTNEDCSGDDICQDGDCVPSGGDGCQSNEDCPEGFVCNPVSGDCSAGNDQCSANADCPAGYVCNLATNQCQLTGGSGYSCAADADCPTGYYCEDEACVPKPCASDADCGPGGICNTNTGTCATPTTGGDGTDGDPCAGFEECDVEQGYLCDSILTNTCRMMCLSTADCVSAGLVDHMCMLIVCMPADLGLP